MKKVCFIFTLCYLTMFSFAQVAINTTGAAPHASAMLDLTSSNKGLLIPRVYLTSATDNTTIVSPAKSLLIFNSNSNLSNGAGFYYNSSSTSTPNWQPMQDLVLPYYNAASATGSAFAIENYSQTITSSAIRGNGGGSGKGVEGIAGSGTGVFAKSLSGNALEVDGKLKIAGNGLTPAQGKVLTTDASGNATWEGAIAFSSRGILANGSQIIVPGQTKKIAFKTEVYDLGNNYNPAAVTPYSTFTSPVAGIYHFDVQVTWAYDESDFRAVISLMRSRNGSLTTIAMHDYEKPYGLESQQLSVDCQLLAGDQIYVNVEIVNTNTNQILVENEIFNHFSGRLVIKL